MGEEEEGVTVVVRKAESMGGCWIWWAELCEWDSASLAQSFFFVLDIFGLAGLVFAASWLIIFYVVCFFIDVVLAVVSLLSPLRSNMPR